jgi:hypothetical protein
MAALDAFDAHILPHVMGCPTPAVEWAVRLACIDFCNRVELVTEDATIDTVAGQATYDPFLALQPVDYVARRLLGVWRGTEELTDGRPASPVDEQAAPLHYYLTGTGLIGLNPIPSDIETLTARVVVRPTIDAVTVPDALVSQYSETIAAGALARLHGLPGKLWTDHNLAQLRQRDFDHACGIAQWQVDGLSRGSSPLRTSPSPI